MKTVFEQSFYIYYKELINFITENILILEHQIPNIMINKSSYDIYTVDGKIHVTITPVIQSLPDGIFFQTGVFRLHNGVVGMGTITFDDEMKTWKYEGLDAFTYNEAAEIAEFIRNFKDPEDANPALLQ